MARGDASESLKVGRRRVGISHPGKLLFRGPDLSKLDLAHHYERVAGAMLAHVKGRPLALEVFPRGIDQRGYFMSRCPTTSPTGSSGSR
jgi:bifunctional non-homologous end joining protein LigD